MPQRRTGRALNWLAPASTTRRALDDLLEGLAKSWLWFALAKQDIRLRYRGSVLGPFWLTISTLVMVGAMGALYARLLHMPAARYLPFLAVGLVTWQFVATTINDGCQTFLAARFIIQQVRLPVALHAYRVVCRNLLVLAHNALIVPLALLAFQVHVDWRILLVPLGLLVLSLNGVWISLLLGMISARFRDVPPIVASVVQLIFFVTPIFWSPTALGRWQRIAELNPLFADVDIVRAPLIGQDFAPYSWLIAILWTLVGWIVTFSMFSRFRGRIAFWV